MPKTAVVILNFNGAQFLEQFLPQVIANSGDAEIIVADNASTDNSIEILKTQFPDIRLIENQSNTGFAGGYNEALQHVEAEYYVLLNSDVEVTPDWITPLEKCLDENPKIAACQPKILAHHNKNLFEHAGAAGGFLDRFYYPLCRGRIFDHVEEDKGQYDENCSIFWATGACMMIRSSVFHACNGFDSNYFAHMEEIDLCWRIKSLDLDIHYITNSKVYHVGGGTLNYMSPFKTFLNFRNSLYTIHKNHARPIFPIILWRLILDGLAGVKFVLGGEWKHCISIIKAHFNYYKMIPTLQKQRKEIRSKRKVVVQTGILEKSIVWQYYMKKIDTFKKLLQ